jgi:hypothetical protein
MAMGHLNIHTTTAVDFQLFFDFEFFQTKRNYQVIKLCAHSFKFRGSTFNAILVLLMVYVPMEGFKETATGYISSYPRLKK